MPVQRSQPVHQVYLTHCLLVDSVFHVPEFTVRAASPMNHDLLRLVDRYPTFELPVVLWSKDPTPEHAPRRLALINLNVEKQALIHSAYLTRDTVGRVGNHFTHVLVGPRFDPLEAIQSWAAPGWKLSYPPGEDKELPPPKGVPQGTALSDENLERFLSDERLEADDLDLATQTIPERLLNDPRRRELLARFMQAIVLIVQQEENRRGPLYVHAEPGLLALLLYGAFRLLPRGWTYDLTFTTYENPDTTLRSYDRALVVGTYMDDPRRHLESEYVERYGYGIDTFHADCCSAEFRGQVPEAVDALLDLAAAGDWDVIERLHDKCGNARVKLAGIRDAVRRLRAVTRLGKGVARLEDLTLLAGDDEWRTLFDEHEETYWPKVRDACLADPALALRFMRTLRKEHHLKDLRRDAANRLANEDFAGWERDWALIRSVVSKQEKEQFKRLVEEGRLGEHPDAEVKAVLRREWLRLENRERPGKPPESPPWPRLLRAESEPELARLLNDPEIPAHWKAGTLCHAVLAGNLTDSVRGHLLAAETAIFDRVLHIGRNKFHENPASLVKLIAGDPPAFDLMGRILATGVKYLSASTWASLCRRLHSLDRDPWDNWWLQNDHLTHLLVCLEDVPAARDIWEPYVLELTAKKFLIDLRMIKVFVQIMRAYEKVCIKILDMPVNVLMPEEITALERIRVHLALDYPETVFHFPDAKPLLEKILTPEALRTACRHWPDGDKSQVEPLRVRFNGGLHKTNVVYAQLRPNDEMDRKRLDVFFRDVFQRFYPVNAEELWAPALIAWCRMIRDCTPEKQLALQKYFVRELNLTVEQRYQLRVQSGNVLLPNLAQQIELEYAELQQRRKEAFDFDREEPEDSEEGGDFNFPSTNRPRKRGGKRF